MSIFDKASMVLLAAGAAGKGGNGNGTAYSIKPTNGDGDLNLNRGSDLGATRIGKDGLLEKGRENLCYNSVFAGAGTDTDPTGWGSSNKAGGGTFAPLASDSEKIKVEITDASNASDRWFLLFSQSGAGVYTTSIYVDEVTGTAPAINQVMTSIASTGTKTEIAYFKDGEKIAKTDAVEAGHRYSYAASHSGNSVHRWGLGTSSDITATCSVTISQPQIEAGLVGTDYIKNTSTSDSAKAGVLIDEPRFDYKGGGCPKLLIEPQSQNLIHKSEYMGDYTFTNCYSTVSHNHGISPEGIKNSTLFSATAEASSVGHRLFGSNNFAAEVGETYTVSVFAKKGTKRYFAMTLRQSNQAAHGHTDVIFDLEDGSVSGTDSSTGSTEDYGSGWYRCIITVSLTNTSDILARPYLFIAESSSVISYANSTTDDNIELYGLQVENRPSVTSYIPSHGVAAVTRDADVITNVAIPEVNDDEYTFFVHDVNGLEENANRGPRLSDQTSGAGNNSLMGYYVNNGSKVFFCYTDTGSTVKAFPNVSKTDVDAKYAFVIDNVNLRAKGFLNGDLIGDNTPTVTTEPTHLTIASAAGDPNEIHQIMYFPMALSNTEVKILTGATNYASFEVMADALTNYTTYE